MSIWNITRPLPWAAPRVAVLEMFGVLGTTVRSAEYVRTIGALAEDNRVRAVVVDVDSPGGSAAVADQLYRAIARLAARKPTIAFIRGSGLSGGYLLSCGASRIVAVPTALVGSIGVIFIRPVVQEMLEKVGVKVVVTRVGPFKDMWQPFREPTPEEQQKVEALTDEYYRWFIEAVARSRRLDVEVVRQYATGEMFTAQKAREMGLIDELGDMDTALDMACELGRVPRRLAYVRPRRPLLERVLGRAAASLVSSLAAELEARLWPRVEFR